MSGSFEVFDPGDHLGLMTLQYPFFFEAAAGETLSGIQPECCAKLEHCSRTCRVTCTLRILVPKVDAQSSQTRQQNSLVIKTAIIVWH